MALPSSCNITEQNISLSINYSMSFTSRNLTCFVPTVNPSNLPIGNDTDVYVPMPDYVKYLCYVFYGLVMFFGIFGNILVFYVIGYRKKRRNNGDIYVLSLACTDFLVSIFAPILMLNYLIQETPNWIYGDAMCYFFSTINPITLCCSAWLLVLISIDRYR